MLPSSVSSSNSATLLHSRGKEAHREFSVVVVELRDVDTDRGNRRWLFFIVNQTKYLSAHPLRAKPAAMCVARMGQM